MAEKTDKYQVVHPKLFFAVDGKLQHIAAGEQVQLTLAAAKRLRSKVLIINNKPAVKVDSKET